MVFVFLVGFLMIVCVLWRSFELFLSPYGEKAERKLQWKTQLQKISYYLGRDIV